MKQLTHNAITAMQTIYILLMLCMISIKVNAQTDTDSLFGAARQLAFGGNYVQARLLCDSILAQSPEYAEVLILKGRTYAWEKQTEEARQTLLKALELSGHSDDAFIALADNELWAGYYGRAEMFAMQGLSEFPQSVQLHIKLAQIQYTMAKYHPALASVDTALASEPDNATALKLREDILDMLKQDKLKLQHSTEWFDVPYTNTLHVTSLEYIKNFKKLVVIPRISYAMQKIDSLKRDDKQAELDLYYQLTPITSLYANYGYGADNIFPRHRHGMELFQRLPKGLEASIGYRLLYYDIGSEWSDVYTGSISKYWKNFWFSFRPYIAPSDSSVSSSYYLYARYYYNTIDDIVELSLGSGFSADESVYAQMNAGQNNYLSSYRAGIRAQYRYKRIGILHAGAGLRYEEYAQEEYRQVYYINAGCSLFLPKMK